MRSPRFERTAVRSPRLERDAGADIAGADRAGRGDQFVQIARSLACIARDLGGAFLVVIELFEREHREEDVVLFEAEQTGGVVHQYVGIEHEEFGRGCLDRCVDVKRGAKFALDHGPPWAIGWVATPS